MVVEKMLLVLALVAATFPGHLTHASLWGPKVFPDDRSWLSPSFKSHELDDPAENEVNTRNYKVCETDVCKEVAEEFLNGMNKSVDPCEDFWEFTCGAWPAKDPIPPHKAAWSRFMIIQNTIEHRVKGILESKPSPSDILPLRQAKKWYQSCMNTENLNRRGIEPIESILIRTGGWPIVMDEEEWDSEEHTWQKVDRQYARLTGALTFYNVEVVYSDIKQAPILIIKAPEIPLADQMPVKYRNYSGNDYETYLNVVQDVVSYFVRSNRANVSDEMIRRDAEDMVEFEKKIYELKEKFSSRDFTSLDKFFEWYETNRTEVASDPKTNMEWRAGIQGLFSMINFKLNTSMATMLREFGYLSQISELFKVTSSRTIVNYIHWKFVATMLPYTTESARDALFNIIREEYGVKERAPRWSECVNDMKMSHAAAFEFIEKYFPESTQSAAREIMQNVQNGMEAQIEKSNWLNQESKEWAIDKLKNMNMFIGFPDWYKNKTAVINRYKGLTIGAEYFDNTLSYMRFAAKKNLKKISSGSNKFDLWDVIDPITVNAVYGGPSNMLTVPAADFQAPLLTPDFPKSVDYATAGVVAGHEMGHGFDDSGIFHGKSLNATKLPRLVLMSYYQNSQCFFNQFKEYYGGLIETKLPEDTTRSPRYARRMSMQTMGENIADSTGLQSVFEAYQEINKALPNGDTKLPGLEEYTDDQLFFISFGAMWCQVDRPEYAIKKQQARDPHSPAILRVRGGVSNAKGFAEAFKCPKGSPMNPTNKCNIWQASKAKAKPKPDGKTEHRIHNRWAGQWKN